MVIAYVHQRGVVVNAPTSQLAELAFISLSHIPKTSTTVFPGFLLDAHYNWNSVRSSWQVCMQCPLVRYLNEIPSSLCNRQVVEFSSIPIVVVQSNKKVANKV